jgi:DNA-binding CsgD family transcriptional regulator
LGQWLNELYNQARLQQLSQFKLWCFDSLKVLMHFDSGLWATRSDLRELRREHWVDDTCLFNQADDFMANYIKIDSLSNITDPLNQHLISHPGKFFSIWDCCPKAQWVETDYYLKHCRLFNVENAISALTLPTEDSAVSHVFSFYRADSTNEFTADEILLADFILPNLVEAFRINVLSSFCQTLIKGKVFRAVLDRFGEMMEAEFGFYQLMHKKGLLEKSRVNIPELNGITSSSQLQLAGLKLDITFNDGLFYLEASEGSLIENLSKREYQVIELLSKGCSSKDIANCLSSDMPNNQITAHTVNTHLSNIYKKLNVKHKAGATACFLNYAAK